MVADKESWRARIPVEGDAQGWLALGKSVVLLFGGLMGLILIFI